MESNKLKRIWIWNVVLSGIIILVKIFASSMWIEHVYVTGCYTWLSHIQRSVTKNFPFSIGDILYGWWIVFLIIGVVKFIWVIVKKKLVWIVFFRKTSSLLRYVLYLYVVFTLFWGLNYNRLGIAYQLHLSNGHYTTEELADITHTLLEKVNDTRRKLGGFDYQYPDYPVVFEKTAAAYSEAAQQYSFLQYNNPDVKMSLYGRLGNYSGFTGYYNPFTGEAQVNVRVPAFYLPYIACHEVAHQLGYGDESEANFVGYLAAKASRDTFFHYSAYFDLFVYANRELYLRDSSAAQNNYNRLDTLVKKDYQTAKQFSKQYQNLFNPLVQYIYSEYLKIHSQPKGIDTYDEVIGWLIAYKKKYKKL